MPGPGSWSDPSAGSSQLEPYWSRIVLSVSGVGDAVTDADRGPTAVGRRGSRSGQIVTAPIDDVGPEQVVQGSGEGVHQAGERPDGEQQHPDQSVHLESQWSGCHQFDLG